MLNIIERQVDRTTVLELDGNIIMGGGSKTLGQTVRRLLASGKNDILLNFARVKYLDSSGIGELVALNGAANQVDANLKFSNLPPKVEQVLLLGNLATMFQIYADESEAVKNADS